MQAASPQPRKPGSASPLGNGSNIRRFYLAINAILVIGFVSYLLGSWFEVRKQTAAELDHINGLFIQSIESVFRHHETVLKILGQRFLDVEAALHPERGRRLVDELLAVNPAIAGFGLAQPNGQLLLVSGVPAGKPLPNLLRQTATTASFLQLFDTDRLVVGRTYRLPLLDAWLIPLRIGVRDGKDHVKLVMASGLDINASDAMWNAVKLPPGMQITLLRADGFIQLRLPTSAGSEPMVYDDPVPDAWFSAQHTALDADPFRQASVAVASGVLGGGMRSYVSYPRSQLWAEFGNRLFLPVLLFASALALAAIVFRSVAYNQRCYEQHLMRQAHYDALTGLPNRVLALDRLDRLISGALRSQRSAAVLFLDLDDFKRMNDCLGHDVGDAILIETARRLQQVVRANDTVARLGGDEFIILLGGLCTPDDVQPIAEKLLEQLRVPFCHEHRELVLSASIGIALFPDNGQNAAALLRKADTAMYHSKKLGRNACYFFSDEMNQRARRQLMVEEQLRGAIQRSELYLEYQPMIDVRSGQTAGAEALLRWNNVELGQIFPDEFIPIAEKSGLIVPIGRFVLKRALQQLAIWHEHYDPKLKIAVNLSPRQFRDPQLLPFIQQTLVAMGVASNQLELEITEGVMIDRYLQVDTLISTLKEMGVSIAMDDFGTGYSSMSYLRNHPFDTLKIDRTFVSGISDDAKDRELVNAIITTAQSLGMNVVAEGVELAAQLDYLAGRGCDFAQGYLFSRPLSEQDIQAWMREGKERQLTSCSFTAG